MTCTSKTLKLVHKYYKNPEEQKIVETQNMNYPRPSLPVPPRNPPCPTHLAGVLAPHAGAQRGVVDGDVPEAAVLVGAVLLADDGQADVKQAGRGHVVCRGGERVGR